MKRLLFVLALLFLGSCTPDEGGPAGRTLESRIVRIENGLTPVLQIKGQEPVAYNVVDRLNELNIPSLSVAFATNGVVQWKRSYGLADVTENRPMQTNTLLLAGSISKPVAALRAHQLVEEGVFDLACKLHQ